MKPGRTAYQRFPSSFSGVDCDRERVKNRGGKGCSWGEGLGSKRDRDLQLALVGQFGVLRIEVEAKTATGFVAEGYERLTKWGCSDQRSGHRLGPAGTFFDPDRAEAATREQTRGALWPQG